MKSTLWWLGMIFSTLSVVMLVKQGFDYGFVAPLQQVLAFYEQATQALFGWAEPLIREQLATLRAWTNWNFDLQPHWKHFLILMWLYCSAFASRDVAVGQLWRAFAVGAWAGIVAISAGMCVGLLSLEDPRAFAVPAGFIVLFHVGMIGGYVLGTYGGSRLHWFLRWFRQPESALPAVVVAGFSLIASIAMMVPPLVDIEGRALVSLAGLLLVLAAFWLWLGRSSYLGFGPLWGQKEAALDPQLVAAKQQHFANIGIFQLRTILGASLFLLTNAGLKLAGL
jgi:hypothetical protein